MSARRLHIVLIGFMGSGKSTIGSLLAEQLNRPFVDLDQEVVKSEQLPIPEIFAQKGETYFRSIENKILQSVLISDIPSIISTGGGAPCFLNGMKYIEKCSYSFYLKVGRSVLYERIKEDKFRPLVQHKTKQELKQFIDTTIRNREKFYKKANRTILAYDKPEEIVHRIVRYLDKEDI